MEYCLSRSCYYVVANKSHSVLFVIGFCYRIIAYLGLVFINKDKQR